MRILVISDIHGNLPALEQVFKHEKTHEMLISLGDVVNFGPWSNECVQYFEHINAKLMLLGNHDAAFIKGRYEGDYAITQAFFETCYPDFNQHNSLTQYKTALQFEGFDLAHTLHDQYIFPETEITLKSHTLIGHSHHAFQKIIGEFQLVCPGSVGQNRKNPNEINYAIWETADNSFELKSLHYDINILLNAMRAKKYPDICMNYILSKLH